MSNTGEHFHIFEASTQVESTVVLLLLCWRWIRAKGIRIQLKKLHLSTHVELQSSCVVLLKMLHCSSWLPAFDLLRQYPGATPRKLWIHIRGQISPETGRKWEFPLSRRSESTAQGLSLPGYVRMTVYVCACVCGWRRRYMQIYSTCVCIKVDFGV